MMCSATLYQQFSPGEQTYPFSASSKALIAAYRTKITQCLVLGNYTKTSAHTIETLVIYMQIEFLLSPDTQITCWLLLGIIIRLAIRMGYHRDGSHFPRISPYTAEMRRRVWGIVKLLDVSASCQVGLPRMITESQYDTAEPRNLREEDLSQDMVELPAGMPEDHETAVQYFISKNRIISIYGQISDFTTSSATPNYAEVLRLDSVLDEGFRNIPAWLCMRSMGLSIMDGSDRIIRRMYVAITYYKAKCVLHRRHLFPGRTDGRYGYSRTSCVDAALQILQCQETLDQEMQADGRLHKDRWKITSLVKTDFLLATTILCVDLNWEISTESCSAVSADADRSDKVLCALNSCYQIWLRSSDSSREAKKAAEVLRIVLGKAQKVRTRRAAGLGRGASGVPHVMSRLPLRRSPGMFVFSTLLLRC